MKKHLQKVRRWWKSSVTGKFVSRKFNEEHPEEAYQQERKVKDQ